MEFPARVLDKIDASGDCWEWTASKWHGYGQVWWQGSMRWAHRVVWEVLSGANPKAVNHRPPVS